MAISIKRNPTHWDINHAQNGSYAAGREGVRNKDINALLSWKMTPQQILDFSYAYSRQGNIYAGDTRYSNGNLSPNGLVDSCTATKLIASIASPGD